MMPTLLPEATELAHNLDASIREKLNDHERLLAGQAFADLDFARQIQCGYLSASISKLSFQYFSIVKDDEAYQKKAIEACKNAQKYDVTKKNIMVQLEAEVEHGPAWLPMFLCHCYFNGIGISIDQRQAFLWCQFAAAQGNAHAHYSLGCMYANAYGIEKNEEKMREHYLMASHTEPAAQYALGQIYEQGQGVAMDLHEACAWYRLAAAQTDCSCAVNKLRELEIFLTNLQLYQCIKVHIDAQLEILKTPSNLFFAVNGEHQIKKIKESLELLYRSLKEKPYSTLDEMLDFVIKTKRTLYTKGSELPRTVVVDETLSLRKALNISRDNVLNFAGGTLGALFSNTSALDNVVHALEPFNTSSSARLIARFGLMPAQEVFLEPGEWIEMQTWSSSTRR